RFLRYRHIRENADPDLAGAFHVARERAARRFDLPRGDALRLERLEAEMAKSKINTRGRNPFDPAFVRLAELGAHRLQHDLNLPFVLLRPIAQLASRRGRPASPSAIFLSCAMGSCSMISPLKIQTLTPQV